MPTLTWSRALSKASLEGALCAEAEDSNTPLIDAVTAALLSLNVAAGRLAACLANPGILGSRLLWGAQHEARRCLHVPAWASTQSASEAAGRHAGPGLCLHRLLRL